MNKIGLKPGTADSALLGRISGFKVVSSNRLAGYAVPNRKLPRRLVRVFPPHLRKVDALIFSSRRFSTAGEKLDMICLGLPRDLAGRAIYQIPLGQIMVEHPGLKGLVLYPSQSEVREYFPKEGILSLGVNIKGSIGEEKEKSWRPANFMTNYSSHGSGGKDKVLAEVFEDYSRLRLPATKRRLSAKKQEKRIRKVFVWPTRLMPYQVLAEIGLTPWEPSANSFNDWLMRYCGFTRKIGRQEFFLLEGLKGVDQVMEKVRSQAGTWDLAERLAYLLKSGTAEKQQKAKIVHSLYYTALFLEDQGLLAKAYQAVLSVEPEEASVLAGRLEDICHEVQLDDFYLYLSDYFRGKPGQTRADWINSAIKKKVDEFLSEAMRKSSRVTLKKGLHALVANVIAKAGWERRCQIRLIFKDPTTGREETASLLKPRPDGTWEDDVDFILKTVSWQVWPGREVVIEAEGGRAAETVKAIKEKLRELGEI